MRSKVKVDFDSVVLEAEKKEQIKAAMAQLKHHDTIFNKWGFGKIFEKGTAISMIFYGIPGTGKTLMAQAIANKLKQELLVVSSAEIETQVPGGAERNIKRMFKIGSGEMAGPTGKVNKNTGEAVPGKVQKHVLLFDECDSLITNRNNVGMLLAAQINTILSELEQFTGVVIFTTNRIEALDEAIERRLNAKVEFEFPNEKLRKKIWARMIPAEAPIDPDVDFDELAKFEVTGGTIKNIVLNAARQAAYEGKTKIDLDCFLDNVKKEVESNKTFKKAIDSRDFSKRRRPGHDIEKGDDGMLRVKRTKTKTNGK